ncbi:carbonate dehydratase [Methylibium rhizosphaerae]|jgi:carbonic anhydrase|uniref:carbonate dehydratase n=1 Tax=Methylibium rhizosphaerae TaxID=2570323 RepID=UPI001126F120|nr:carbonate dehydratase [Methylibium rhizosphaerae]
MTTDLKELFDSNREWAARTESREPGFFTRLLKQQAPQYLWIGCADSRVPANELVGLLPGELFVHRNVANVVAHSDLNCLSVIQFAIDALRVKHIIVVGHSNCGGVKAALEDQRVGLVDNWLRHVQDVRNRHQHWIDSVAPSRRVNALCELNVLEQALNVCQTTVVQDAWQRGQEVVVHGWVYGLHNGLLKDLRMTVTRAEDVPRAYEQALAALHRRYEDSADTGPAPLLDIRNP